MALGHLSRNTCTGVQGRDATVIAPAHAHPRTEERREATGFVLIKLTAEPIYTNEAARNIFAYPSKATDAANSVKDAIAAILQGHTFTLDSPETTFRSGRRTYVCRCFLLEPRDGEAQPMMALLLDRSPRQRDDVSEASRRFRLSRREDETVRHLVDGLTTKEVAERMRVSPNTVKQFVRLVMTKMGVTTRAGVVGKMLSR